jgi:hypothetical protein
MKKVLTIGSVLLGNLTLAFAQMQISIGQTATQGQVNGGALLSLLALAQNIVTRLVPFAIGLAVLAFFWFLIGFIWKGKDDPAKQQEMMRGMGFSILALFAMVSIWGIIGLLGSFLGVGQGGSVPVPGIPSGPIQ